MSDWLQYSPSSGCLNGTITITAATYSELEERLATIQVYNTEESLTATTDITQFAQAPTSITLDSISLEWVTDIPSSGGTATKDNCSYVVYGYFSDGSVRDITNLVTITGSQYIPPTTSTTRDSAGTLTLTATYGGLTSSAEVEIYQSPNTIVGLDMNVDWIRDIPASGGTATKDNCDWIIYPIYSNGSYGEDPIPVDEVISDDVVVPLSLLEYRHSAGTITLTANSSGLSTTANTKIYQAAPVITGIRINDLNWLYDVPEIGGAATRANCEYTIYAYYDNGTYKDITTAATVTGGFYVPETTATTRQSVGVLTLTASYSGFTHTATTTAYQEEGDFMPNADRMYLTIDVSQSGVLKWSSYYSSITHTIQYSKDNGSTWTSVTSTTGGTNISVNAGDVVLLKGNGIGGYDGDRRNSNFRNSTATFSVYGNILSLIAGDNFYNYDINNGKGSFAGLFENCIVTTARHLILPTKTFIRMYDSMFFGCGSLTKAPVLPATTLSERCYTGMFGGCTGLTAAPTLPATTLAPSCYYYMFYHNENIRSIICLATDISAYDCTENWFMYTTDKGNFVKNKIMNDWTKGDDGIRKGWVIVDADI